MAKIRKTRTVVAPGASTGYAEEYWEETADITPEQWESLNAEGTGEGTQSAGGGEELEPGEEERLRLRDAALDGVDPGASESSSGDAEPEEGMRSADEWDTPLNFESTKLSDE